ncbi:MAG: 6-phosphogluconolactonase [Arachnia sp.]
MTASTPAPRIFGNGLELGKALAAAIADRVSAAHAHGDSFILGCPGGRTPTSTYQSLAEEFTARGIDRRRVVIAMMDDYVEWDGTSWAHIPSDAHNSCRRFAREDIQGVLNRGVPEAEALPDANLWFPNPAEPEAYDGRLREAGGIDFFILASGAGDGHVAFNPPGSPIDSRTRVVELAEQTRRDNLATFPDYQDLDAVPGHGVTVGIATIAELSKAAAMIVIGSDKQQAYQRLTAGRAYDPGWPATVYHLVPGAEIFADVAAEGRAC